MNEVSTVGPGFAAPANDDTAPSIGWTCEQGHVNQPGRHFCSMCGEQLPDHGSTEHGVVAPMNSSAVLPSQVSVHEAIEAGETSGANGSWVPFTAFIALAAWIAAGWTSLAVKLGADHAIAGSYDISAIQIQQLNGSVTSHVLVALVLALAATIPLLVAVSARACSLLAVRR